MQVTQTARPQEETTAAAAGQFMPRRRLDFAQDTTNTANTNISSTTPSVPQTPPLTDAQRRQNLRKKYETRYPICVDSCPINSDTFHSCIDSTTKNLVAREDYPTHAVGKYCLPVEFTAIHSMLDIVGHWNWSGHAHYLASQLYRARAILLCSCFAAALTGCIYLVLVEKAPGCVLYISVVIYGGIPLGAGYCLVRTAIAMNSTDPNDPEAEADLADTASRDLAVGCFLLGLGTFVAIVSMSALRMLRSCLGCIRATCECIMQDPSILLQPFLSLLTRVSLLLILGHGLLLLLSVGASGEHGMRKTFSYDSWVTIQIVYYIFVTIWLLHYCTALSQYSLAWVTQCWYFTPYEDGKKRDLPKCAAFQGIWSGAFFHPGSLALGSFLSLCGSLPFGIAVLLASIAGKDICCGGRRKSFMAAKCIYMDIAMTSDGYCGGAHRAGRVLETEGAALTTLNVAQWVYFLAGYATIVASGACTASLLLQTCPACFFDADEGFVKDYFTIISSASILSFFIAQTFMVVFDVVGDTIMYCLILDSDRKQEEAQMRHERRAAQEEKSWFEWLVAGGLRCAEDNDEGSPSNGEDEDWASYTPFAVRDLMIKNSAVRNYHQDNDDARRDFAS
mmetsp:Transcript_21365/g.46388  ORF Transcript_21365/g.46388 Transcript_21365/m.46388 type:complete len:620 (-) Transcript_21365:277-2136(-)